MRYILTAESYFSEQTAKPDYLPKLEQYFAQIPISFFETLEAVNLSALSAINSISSNHTDDEIIEHQRFLLESDDIFSAIRQDDLLSRSGLDTVELYKNSKYLAELAKLNEGVIGTVMNFIKSITADPDPTEYALNVLRLILDVIGIIPFTWAGFPIDVVANGLSAMISWHKEEYFSAVLSGIAMIDVTHASAVIGKIFTGPAAKLLNGFFKILGRPEAIKVEAVALREGIIHIGGKPLLKSVVDLFKNFAKFLITIPLKILQLAITFIRKVFGMVPLVGKFAEGAIKIIDKLILNINVLGKNVDLAAKLLEEGAVKDLAKSTTSTSKTVASDLAKKAGETKGYLKDLELEIRRSKEYEAILKTGDKSSAELFVKAKTGNALTGETVKSLDQAAKNAKSLTGDAAKAFVEKLDGKAITDFIKNSSDAEVKNLIEGLLTNPALAKELSVGEKRCLGIFSNNPTALKESLKYFDDTEKVLKTLYKLGGAAATRAVAFRHLINFIARQVWRIYQPACYVQKVKAAVTGAVSEESTTFGIPAETLNKIKETNPEAYSEIVKTMENQPKKDEPSKKRNPCSTSGAIVNAVVGATVSPMLPNAKQLANTYGGDKMVQASTQYSSEVLKSLNLDSKIDPQHPLPDMHPVAKAYYSDVYDFKENTISLNTGNDSRMDSILADMVKSGEIKQDQVEEVKKAALESQRSGNPPADEDSTTKPEKTNETQFKVKGFEYLYK